MKLLSVGAPLRGVAAFLATIAIGFVALTALIAAYSVWRYGGWSWLSVPAIFLSAWVFAAPLSVVVLFATLVMQVTRAPRPLVDIAVWGTVTVVQMLLWLSIVPPRFRESASEPLDIPAIATLFAVGGIGGFVYWFLAGRPTPPHDN